MNEVQNILRWRIRRTMLTYYRSCATILIVVINATFAKFVLASSARTTTHRQEQESCSPPSGGCSGPGLWDDGTCQCLCLQNYCYDAMAGTCSTVSLLALSFLNELFLTTYS